MKTGERLGQLGLLVAGAAIAIVAYETGRARADVPTTNRLVYSGYLEEPEGTSFDGAKPMIVELSDKDGKKLCSVARDDPKDLVAVKAGRFSLDLDDCAAEIPKGDVWVALTVDGIKLSPRSKISAVPYALEANNAKTIGPEGQQALTDKVKAELADPECPPGYERKEDLIPWTGSGQALPEIVYCVSENGTGNDEVVRVGAGHSAFWIDRYEASIWPTPTGYAGDLNAQKFRFPTMDDTIVADFPRNGQVKKGKELYAVSGRGVTASCNVSWFQAAEACAASGKRLPTGAEWLRAGRGTHDPEIGIDGLAPNNLCNTLQPMGKARESGKAIGDGPSTSCISDWGAEDMIGNFGEWTADWLASVGTVANPFDKPAWGELDGYGFDKTFNIVSKVEAQPNGAPAISIDGLPAAIVRGGNWTEGVAGGLFTFTANVGPTFWHRSLGFRCMIPR